MNTTWTRNLVALAAVAVGSTFVGLTTARAGSDETFGPRSYTAGYGAAVPSYSVPLASAPVVNEVPVVSGPTTTYYAPTPTVAYSPVTTAAYAQPVTTYYSAPVTTYYAPPVTTYYAPTPVTTYYAAPVTSYYAPVTTYYAPSVPVTTYYAPAAAYYAPTTTYYAPAYYYYPVRRGLFGRW